MDKKESRSLFMGQAKKAEKAFKPILKIIFKYLKEAGVNKKPVTDRPWDPVNGPNPTIGSYWDAKRNGKKVKVRSAMVDYPYCFLIINRKRVAQRDFFRIVLDYEAGGLFKPAKPLGIFICYGMQFEPDNDIDRYKILSRNLGELGEALKSVGFELHYTTPDDTWSFYNQDVTPLLRKRTKDVAYYFCSYIRIQSEINPASKGGIPFADVQKLFEKDIGPLLLKNLKGLSNALGNHVIEGVQGK